MEIESSQYFLGNPTRSCASFYNDTALTGSNLGSFINHTFLSCSIAANLLDCNFSSACVVSRGVSV